MKKAHTFHIPVMGIGFTIDSPLKVSKYGIDSVISLVDDILLEKMRKIYSFKYEIPFKEISDKVEDFRAKRVTMYLDLIHSLSKKKFEKFKNATISTKKEIQEYFNLLPDTSSLKQEFKKLTKDYFNANEIKNWLNENLKMGGIDVNIMTKIDKDNYKNNIKLPVEYNDAHAALRGFANSTVNSSLVLSAGMNPRLYTYLEQFKDFYPEKNGNIKKKITLKVSDYRSALIQGKFLAKKGIWVSEYRIESGLNCGGHAFATDGYLLGPVLEEFKEKREELRTSIQEILFQSFSRKKHEIPSTEMDFKVSAQGGVGTTEEHQFLLDYYQIDSVGWGSPFLLVPEATTVDKSTLEKLIDAKEEDLYLSNISPLGVPFNNLKGNTKDAEKNSFIEKGRPGSPCPKRFVALNNEFDEKGMCTASRQFQRLKVKQLDEEQLSTEEHQIKYNKIIEKTCICVGLGTSALLVNDVETKIEGPGVSICPGPNIAYFSKTMSLKEITDSIYGRTENLTRSDRPNMFIKELHIYMDYLKSQLNEVQVISSQKQIRYLKTFSKNLKESIQYYTNLFKGNIHQSEDALSEILSSLTSSSKNLLLIDKEIEVLV